ncbi:Pex12 amino terminal region-domain-containing protein [Powellomyces hirtus]|nr:Pex12 amino terminal region-domain-containing protein [Powellomyces hirtus]
MEYLSNLGAAGDAYRPSLFELVAQDKMRDLLKPAVRYVMSVYAQRYPRHLLRLVNRHDEIFSVLMLLIEQHYLREWDASFAEHFYGLKRTAAGASRRQRKGVHHLTSSQIWRSVFCLVAVPYIKTKLDETFETVSGGPGSHIFGNMFSNENETVVGNEPALVRYKKRSRKLFRIVYPYVNAVYQGLIFVYQIGYMYGKTDYYSPWLHLCGLQTRRMSMKDYSDQEDRQKAAKQVAQAALQGASRFRLARHMIATILTRGFDFLKYALPMSIFFFKFLEWWYSSEYHNQAGTKPIPPPPEAIPPNPAGLPVPADSTICPICAKTRTNPTMIPSGYVFCYPCIYKYVDEMGKCPITWIETKTEELRKIYSM